MIEAERLLQQQFRHDSEASAAKRQEEALSRVPVVYNTQQFCVLYSKCIVALRGGHVALNPVRLVSILPTPGRTFVTVNMVKIMFNISLCVDSRFHASHTQVHFEAADSARPQAQPPRFVGRGSRRNRRYLLRPPLCRRGGRQRIGKSGSQWRWW